MTPERMKDQTGVFSLCWRCVYKNSVWVWWRSVFFFPGKISLTLNLYDESWLPRCALIWQGGGAASVWGVWGVGGSGEWCSACLRSFHNYLPFQPLNLALGTGIQWRFWEAGRTSFASSVSQGDQEEKRQLVHKRTGAFPFRFLGSLIVWGQRFLLWGSLPYFFYFKFLLSFFHFPFYFEMPVEPRVVVRNNTDRSLLLFTQSPQW